MLSRITKKIRSHWILFLIGAFFVFGPSKLVYAGDAASAAIYGLVLEMFNWLKGEMMQAFQGYLDDVKDGITDKLDENFKNYNALESMAGNLKSQFSQAFEAQRQVDSQAANNQAKGYLDYTQGSASGYNAGKQPAAVVQDMNKKYDEVQNINKQCQLDNPQYAGTNDDGCQPQQLTYTNTLLAGVTPLPVYSTTQQESPVGQQYELERKESVTRQQLANKAVSSATDPNLKKFMDQASSTLATPTREDINAESDAAVTRDTLITLQTIGDIMVKQFQAEIENQRLLGTLVAQNEEIHAQYMRDMQKQLAQ